MSLLESFRKRRIFSKNNNMFLTKNSTNTIPQVPYSLDIVWLFPRLKFPLRGHRFESIDAMKENSLQILKRFHEVNDIKACFENWKKRHKYIVIAGDYFEGDEINFDE